MNKPIRACPWRANRAEQPGVAWSPRREIALAVCLVATLWLPRDVGGQERGRASELLEILGKRPRGMTVDTWREQRREAARELGRARERRAVPELLRIIERERFDVILEIAIDALGNIGDRRAIEPLRRLLSDPSLDGYVRDAVAGALQRLGAESGSTAVPPMVPPPETQGSHPRPQPPSEQPRQPTAPSNHVVAHPTETGALEGDFAKLPPRALGAWPKDLLARAERLDIVVGTTAFRWDGAAETTRGDVAAGTRYQRRVERREIAYSIDGSASAAFRIDDPAGDDNTSWNIEHALNLAGESRYYPFRNDLPELFAQVSGGGSYGLIVAEPPAALDKRVTFGSALTIGLGPGYGRIYDVGPRLRLRRFVRVLRDAGLLRGALPAAVANELLRTWYELRNAIGTFAPLGYSLRVLGRANALLRQPDPASVYRLVRVLDDPQLWDRQGGMMFRLGYGYARELLVDADDRGLGFLYGTAQLQLQLGTIRELEGAFRFAWNHLGSPDSYTLGLEGSYNWFLYNRALDPLGALGATLSLGLSNQPGSAFEDGGIAFTALGGASYTRAFDRGSRIVASLLGGAQRRGGVVMLSLEARYGVAAGSFALAR